MTHDATRQLVMPEDAFARLGGNEVAYVRRMASEDLTRIFPDAPTLEPGQKLWALLAANGTPILIADSRDAVVANAIENDLMPVSVH